MAPAEDRAMLEEDLAGAAGRDQLHVVYQATFDLGSETVNGVEALLRWHHPARGIMLPGEFIPSAEQTGAIVPIGLWVLSEACRQAAEWRRRGPAITMAVNVSARQFDHDDIVADVTATLQSSGLDPAALVLDITETRRVEDVDRAAGRLRELKHLGVRIAMDNFGRGYSSLSYLHCLPVDIVKIDRSVVRTIAGSRESASLIPAVVGIGGALGLETLAEGIEHEAQLRVVQQAGCGSGQGFLLGRPLATEDAERLFRR